MEPPFSHFLACELKRLFSVFLPDLKLNIIPDHIVCDFALPDVGLHEGSTGGNTNHNASKNTSTGKTGDRNKRKQGHLIPPSPSASGNESMENGNQNVSKNTSTRIASGTDKSKYVKESLLVIKTNQNTSKISSSRTAANKCKNDNRSTSTAPSSTKAVSTRTSSDKDKNQDRLKSKAPSKSSAAHSGGNIVKEELDDDVTRSQRLDGRGQRQDDECTKGQRLEVIGKIATDEPVQVLNIKQTLPPKSKIYFSRTKSKVSCSQPVKSTTPSHADDKDTHPSKQTSETASTHGDLSSHDILKDRKNAAGNACVSQPANTHGGLSSHDNLNDGKSVTADACVSQPDSGSSGGSSSQSTTSLSILSAASRGKTAQVEAETLKEKRMNILIEELETPREKQTASSDYTG